MVICAANITLIQSKIAITIFLVIGKDCLKSAQTHRIQTLGPYDGNKIFQNPRMQEII